MDAVREEEEIKIVAAKVEETGEVKTKVREVAKETEEEQDIPGIRRPGMQIYHHLRPVFAIGPLASPHISAWSRPPAPGKTTTSPRPTTEGPTSSTRTKIPLK